MSEKLNHLVTVRFRRTAKGHFAATSDDLPGLFLTYPTREQIVDDLPDAIRLLFKANYGEDVEVFALDSAADPPELKDSRLPLAAIPTESLRTGQSAE